MVVLLASTDKIRKSDLQQSFMVKSSLQLLQSYPSQMFRGVLNTPLFLIFTRFDQERFLEPNIFSIIQEVFRKGIYFHDQSSLSWPGKFFIHSFSIYSYKKAMNVYMLTCSEAVSQSCSHEQVGALKNARQTRRRTPMRSMISMVLPYSSIKITLSHA